MEEENKPKTNAMLKKEMIKKVDKRKLKKLIAMCFNIKDSEVLGLDDMLTEWANKKLELYKLLGNELKIEKEIDISKEKLEEIEKQTGIPDDGLRSYYTNEFENFRDRLREISPIIENAFNENFSFSYIIQQVPDVNEYVLGGSKRPFYFNKAEKMSFSTLMHKVFLSDKVDVEVSKYLQKVDSNIKGKIYISIDPFDFVTMSMNKSRWSSCHSLHSISGNGVEVGCYSAGIFSYMCDDVSLIAYKTDGEQYKYDINNRSIVAESKNWRQMLFVHPLKKYFIASRQYPYRTEIISKIVREMLEQKIDNCKEVEEDKEVEEENNKWKVSRKSYDNKRIIYNAVFPNTNADMEYQEDLDENEEGIEVLHYNDMLHDYDYQLIYQSKYNKNELENIYIGSNPNCVLCGKNQLIEHHKPICCKCESDHNWYL